MNWDRNIKNADGTVATPEEFAAWIRTHRDKVRRVMSRNCDCGAARMTGLATVYLSEWGHLVVVAPGEMHMDRAFRLETLRVAPTIGYRMIRAQAEWQQLPPQILNSRLLCNPRCGFCGASWLLTATIAGDDDGIVIEVMKRQAWHSGIVLS